ncbi:hypothetical protein [Salinicoccus halodurans]|uniref:hypothetical protein n=1 Tax=Salinicoccus halodurans TaxID=407035 RepID=UPI000A43CE45|nr:hypothetical protein [Salinicoccus halodurans]
MELFKKMNLRLQLESIWVERHGVYCINHFWSLLCMNAGLSKHGKGKLKLMLNIMKEAVIND